MSVVLDIETFRYDLLVGIKDLSTGQYHFYWNKDAKAPLAELSEKQTEVVNYNGNHYDIPLIWNYYFNERNQASWFELSKLIIEDHFKLTFPKTFLNSIDLMSLLQTKQSLKLIEAILGWEIRETTIDFNYEYKLTEEQRREVEFYNRQDLDASEALYNKLKPYLGLRIRLAEYLGIPHDYSIPLPTLMGMGLGAHRKLHERFPTHPLILNVPINHPIKHKMINHLETNIANFSESFVMAGKQYTVGSGGIHSDVKCVSAYNVWHVDVKGYYTLLQMNFDLFSRNIGPEGQKKVRVMYKDRLEMKHTDYDLSNSLKIGLLATWGATKNPYHILYDEQVGHSIPIYGQIFLIYLIELFADAGIDILNANTDGLIVQGDEKLIRELTDKWQKYGDFDVEIVNYKRFIAKDVNNYILGNAPYNLTVKGRDFTAIKKDWLFSNIVLVPQTRVISQLLSEILYIGEDPDFDPEEYVRSKVKNFYVEDYMFIANHTMAFSGMAFLETGERLQRTNRVYASKNGGTIYKFKGEFAPSELVPIAHNGKKGYITKNNLPLFDRASEQDKDFYIVGLSETSDGRKLFTRLADQQYKYPGLPLVKMCNSNLVEVDKNALDIDYEYYVSEVMRKYVAYYNE